MSCKTCILKNFKKLYKTINESSFCNVAIFFYLKSTQREIGTSKGTRKALQVHSNITPRALQVHSGVTPRALQVHSNITPRVLKGHLDPWALGHSGTQGTQVTWAFGHLGTRALEALGHSKST